MSHLQINRAQILPGTSFSDPRKDNFSKKQQFYVWNSAPMVTEKNCKLFQNKNLIYTPVYENTSFKYRPYNILQIPPQLEFNKKVLEFDGYFKEKTQDLFRSTYQIRKIKIFYYLEDGTIQISESESKNSGIPQGCLLSRQKVAKPAPCQNEFITELDINVNQSIKIYGRTFHITDCDLYTRHFLNRMGIHVPDPIHNFTGSSLELHKEDKTKVPVPANKNFSLAQFLKFGNKILKFNGYWKDKSEYGDVIYLEILYHLADDSIEIKRKNEKHSGSNATKTFLKKQKLPKVTTKLQQPGYEASLTLLNVLNGNWMKDPLSSGNENNLYYTDGDLQIGTRLNVYGREIVLTDCDEFTRKYYIKKYGIDVPTRFDNLENGSNQENNLSKSKTSPNNDWGEVLESKISCETLNSKRPLVDFQKSTKFNNIILRFGAKMISKNLDDCRRSFVISFYMENETVQVFELSSRNSGYLGGEFCKRKIQPMPNENQNFSEKTKNYKAHDFYVGATLKINDHIFYLVSAVEYTLAYMEAHSFQFPFSDVETIICKIRQILKSEFKSFITKTFSQAQQVTISPNSIGYCIDSQIFGDLLIEKFGDNLNNHEIITLCRGFSFENGQQKNQYDREKVRSTIYYQITKNLWNGLDRVKEHIYHIAPNNYKHISEKKLRSIISSCRLPFSIELTDVIIQVLKKNNNNEINIDDFISLINTADSPSLAIIPEPSVKIYSKKNFMDRDKKVDWQKFFDKLGLKEDFKNKI